MLPIIIYILSFLLVNVKCLTINPNQYHLYTHDHLFDYHQPSQFDQEIKLLKTNGAKVRSNKVKVTLYREDKTLAIVERNLKTKKMTRCTLFDLEKHEDAVEKSMAKYSRPVEPCDFDVMMSIIKECSRLPSSKGANRTARQKPNGHLVTSVTKVHSVNGEVEREVSFNTSDVQSLWRGIIPGTKWCGLGDEAKYYNDLGEHTNVDRCCRAHDHCPTRMRALRLDYGIINFSLYTRSHCRCDEAFFSCLKDTKSALGDLIGNFYFNIMQTSCIDEAHPCQSIFDPLCRDAYIFKDRAKSVPRVIFVPNKFTY